MKLIDKKLAVELLDAEYDCDPELDPGLEMAVSVIEGMEEIEAEPVKHGKWKVKFGVNVYGGVICRCSECGYELVVSPQALQDEHYCCNCGAKMEEPVNETD